MELCLPELRRRTQWKDRVANAIKHRAFQQRRTFSRLVLDQCVARFAGANRERIEIAAESRVAAQQPDCRCLPDKC